MALPIAGASVGSSLLFGSPSVENTLRALAPASIDSLRVSYQSAIYFDGQTGATVWFAFDQAYYTPPATAAPFVFGGYKNLSAGGLHSAAISYPRVANLDLAVEAPGLDSLKFGVARSYDALLGAGQSDFAFLDTYVPNTALNVPFVFGGELVVAGVTVGELLRFGNIADIRKPQQALPDGATYTGYGKPRVGAFGDITMSFTLPYDMPYGANVPFYFGGQIVARPSGGILAKVGTPSVRNYAQSIEAPGIASLEVGRDRLYPYADKTAGRVNFFFGSTYFPPESALNIPFYFFGDDDLPHPYGYDHLVMGSVLVSYRDRYVAPYDWRSSRYSFTHYIRNKVELVVRPEGRYYGETGEPTIVLVTPEVLHYSYYPQTVFGEPTVEPGRRWLRLAGGSLATVIPDTHLVAPYLRWINHGSFGANTQANGTPYVGERVRYIEPYWFVPLVYGPGTAVIRFLEVMPDGLNDEVFGSAGVSFANSLFPNSFASDEYQFFARVSLRIQAIYVEQAYVESAFTAPMLRNTRQIVQQLYAPDTDFDPQLGYGKPIVWAANAPRYISGYDTSRVSYYLHVRLAAERIAPPSVYSTEFGQQAVSNYTRTIYAPGWHSYREPGWTTVHNTAGGVFHEGFSSLSLGLGNKVADKGQYVRTDNYLNTLAVGAVFVSHTPRTIADCGVPTTYLYAPSHRVSLLEHHIYPEGLAPPSGWAPVVSGPYQKILRPLPIFDGGGFGSVAVVNKIPQAFPYGFSQFVISKAWVSASPRYIAPAGMLLTESDRLHNVRDRRIFLSMQGIQSLVISPKHRVANELTIVLPVTQNVTNAGGIPNAHNQYPPDHIPLHEWVYDHATPSLMGAPHVQNMPRPEGEDFLEFGTTWIRAQGALPKWDWPDSQWSFGMPSINSTQWVVPKPDLPTEEPIGKPRLTPTTIWAQTDPPEQAVRNHPGAKFREVGWDEMQGVPPFFGRARVTTPLPAVIDQWAWQISYDQVPEPIVANRIGTLYVEGADLLRFGFPKLPRNKRVYGIGYETLAFGAAVVDFPPQYIQRIYTEGEDYLRFGRPQTSRVTLFPSGFVGTKWGDNTPMVHHPRTITPTFDATQWGTTWLSHRIRTVYATGDDTMEIGYSFDYFAQRMRVRNKSSFVRPASYTATVYGNAAVTAPAARMYVYQISPARCISRLTSIAHKE